MKPVTPHDPLDDLIAAALHGELTPEERTQFDSRISNDPAARAAYQEAQLMHAMLEGTFAGAQPDPGFEQRMVSGVRRKLNDKSRARETAWESMLVLWRMVKKLPKQLRLVEVAVVMGIIAVLAGVALGPITRGIKQAQQPTSVFSTINSQLSAAQAGGGSVSGTGELARADAAKAASDQQAAVDANDARGVTTLSGGTLRVTTTTSNASPSLTQSIQVQAHQRATSATDELKQMQLADAEILNKATAAHAATSLASIPSAANAPEIGAPAAPTELASSSEAAQKRPQSDTGLAGGTPRTSGSSTATPATTSAAIPAPDLGRKLIRNADLQLEVNSFPIAMDAITALTRTAGGYVDASNAQKGGNGKLHGTVVVKVLPQNLDDFLLKLRDLGQIKNQTVKTDDVTKDYFDTQARLENSRVMEAQLQDLLKHENSKVADLLQVERELGRVRGEIEQMQGTLKLYDFEVQYATVTMQVSEKDINQAAAYLLKEQDEFSLFATDVEGTFQKARQAAENFKAQVLVANLIHNSGSDVAAELTVMVAPDQIESFLAEIRGMGRMANFTRQTERVANDGGDSEEPADQTLTEKDKVQVHLTIHSDDETRKQVALVVVTTAVDDALDKAKAAVTASAGVETLSSSLNKTPQGESTAQLSVRVPGRDYRALLDSFRALGRTASFSLQRDDDSGPGASGDDAPVIVSLSLTDNDTPVQETQMQVYAAEVDHQAQQLKRNAATEGVEVKASSFAHQPDGTEIADMVFRMPMAKYTPFVESLKNLGRVESLSVRRDDRPDQARGDDTAPAEITLRLHNQGDIVAVDNGLWATLRQTFGEGAGALFASVRIIGVIVAFVVPWAFALGLASWLGRRIYLWRAK